MKNIKIFCLLLCLFCSTTASAYIVYNQTDHEVSVRDTYGFRGLGGIIPMNGQLECKSIFGGCKGKLWLYVYDSFYTYRVLCNWNGKTEDKPGTYFVINNVPGKKFPLDGWCQIEYHSG